VPFLDTWRSPFEPVIHLSFTGTGLAFRRRQDARDAEPVPGVAGGGRDAGAAGRGAAVAGGGGAGAGAARVGGLAAALRDAAASVCAVGGRGRRAAAAALGRRSAYGLRSARGGRYGDIHRRRPAERVVGVLDRVDALARSARAAGDGRSLEQLRSDVLCDLALFGVVPPGSVAAADG
jgi:hypothetical protein